MILKQLCGYTFLLILLTTGVFSLDNFGCGKLNAHIYKNENLSAEFKASPWFALVDIGLYRYYTGVLISTNMVIALGWVNRPGSKLIQDEKLHTVYIQLHTTVYLGIASNKSDGFNYKHNTTVSSVYDKHLWDLQYDFYKTLMILVLSEPVSISEYIMPICMDWSMQYDLQNSDSLELEALLEKNPFVLLQRGPTKCTRQNRFVYHYTDAYDIYDSIIPCKITRLEESTDFKGSVITSEHNSLRFLKALHVNFSYRYKGIILDISKQLQWIQNVYRNNTVKCPPVKSKSLEIKCFEDGKEKNCSEKSLPGTNLIPRCKQPLYKLPNGTGKLVCRIDGKWSDRLKDCVPGCGKLPANIYEFGNDSFDSITSPWHAVVIGPYYTDYATLISGNLVILSGSVPEWPSQYINDEKLYTVHLGITHKKFKDFTCTSKTNVSSVYYTNLRDWFDPDINTILTILVLSEPVRISENIMPVCMDWLMQLNLQNSGSLEYEGIIIVNNYTLMLRGPSKCIGQDGCRTIFGNITDIANDTVCCEKPESQYLLSIGAESPRSCGSTITSEHNGLRFLKAIMFNLNSNHQPNYTYTDISFHIPWIQSVYKKHTV